MNPDRISPTGQVTPATTGAAEPPAPESLPDKIEETL